MCRSIVCVSDWEVVVQLLRPLIDAGAWNQIRRTSLEYYTRDTKEHFKAVCNMQVSCDTSLLTVNVCGMFHAHGRSNCSPAVKLMHEADATEPGYNNIEKREKREKSRERDNDVSHGSIPAHIAAYRLTVSCPMVNQETWSSMRDKRELESGSGAMVASAIRVKPA
jgi:hypothetical protein